MDFNSWDNGIVPQSPFDAIRRIDENSNEYWLARELQPLLGYAKWERFQDVIERAKVSCINSGQNAEKHFPDAGKSVEINAFGGQRYILDYRLSRHACYLIAMCGDPRKPEIAAAQAYFATKTREAEIAQSVQLSQSLLEDEAMEILVQTTQNLAAVVAQLAESRKQLKRQQAQINQQQIQIDGLLEIQRQAQEELTALPYSEQPAPEKSTRAKINQIVRNYVSRTNVEYRSVWQQLYKELYYRCGVNVSIRAKHRNANLLDVVEEDGLIEQLHAIATETLK
jgi:hypothetical protein